MGCLQQRILAGPLFHRCAGAYSTSSIRRGRIRAVGKDHSTITGRDGNRRHQSWTCLGRCSWCGGRARLEQLEVSGKLCRLRAHREFRSSRRCRAGRASRLCGARALEPESLVSFGRLDDGQRGHLAEQGQRPDRVPLSRPRSASRDGTACARNFRAISRAHRWTAAGRGSRNRRRRARQRNGDRTADVSADPAAETHRGSTVRDRVSRFGCGSFFFHVRLIQPDAYLLSHSEGRRTFHLLSGSGTEGIPNDSPAPRPALFVANVRAPLRPAFRSLSPCRARLPWLRTQRLAGSEDIRVYVRSLRRNHESLHRSARTLALHALPAGLRWPRGFSHGLGLSGPDRRSDRPGRCGAQRRPGCKLEDASGLFGLIALPTKARFAPVSCRCRRRGRAMSGTIPTWNAMTRICGPTNLPFSTSPARPIFKATSSTTTARTSIPTRSGRPGCARRNLAFSSFGANTTCLSSCQNRRPIVATCRTLKFTFSRPVISHWTRLQMRSPRWSEALSALNVEGAGSPSASRRLAMAFGYQCECPLQRQGLLPSSHPGLEHVHRATSPRSATESVRTRPTAWPTITDSRRENWSPTTSVMSRAAHRRCG